MEAEHQDYFQNLTVRSLQEAFPSFTVNPYIQKTNLRMSYKICSTPNFDTHILREIIIGTKIQNGSQILGKMKIMIDAMIESIRGCEQCRKNIERVQNFKELTKEKKILQKLIVQAQVSVTSKSTLLEYVKFQKDVIFTFYDDIKLVRSMKELPLLAQPEFYQNLHDMSEDEYFVVQSQVLQQLLIFKKKLKQSTQKDLLSLSREFTKGDLFSMKGSRANRVIAYAMKRYIEKRKIIQQGRAKILSMRKQLISALCRSYYIGFLNKRQVQKIQNNLKELRQYAVYGDAKMEEYTGIRDTIEIIQHYLTKKPEKIFKNFYNRKITKRIANIEQTKIILHEIELLLISSEYKKEKQQQQIQQFEKNKLEKQIYEKLVKLNAYYQAYKPLNKQNFDQIFLGLQEIFLKLGEKKIHKGEVWSKTNYLEKQLLNSFYGDSYFEDLTAVKFSRVSKLMVKEDRSRKNSQQSLIDVSYEQVIKDRQKNLRIERERSLRQSHNFDINQIDDYVENNEQDELQTKQRKSKINMMKQRLSGNHPPVRATTSFSPQRGSIINQPSRNTMFFMPNTTNNNLMREQDQRSNFVPQKMQEYAVQPQRYTSTNSNVPDKFTEIPQQQRYTQIPNQYRQSRLPEQMRYTTLPQKAKNSKIVQFQKEKSIKQSVYSQQKRENERFLNSPYQDRYTRIPQQERYSKIPVQQRYTNIPQRINNSSQNYVALPDRNTNIPDRNTNIPQKTNNKQRQTNIPSKNNSIAEKQSQQSPQRNTTVPQSSSFQKETNIQAQRTTTIPSRVSMNQNRISMLQSNLPVVAEQQQKRQQNAVELKDSKASSSNKSKKSKHQQIVFEVVDLRQKRQKTIQMKLVTVDKQKVAEQGQNYVNNINPSFGQELRDASNFDVEYINNLIEDTEAAFKKTDPEEQILKKKLSFNLENLTLLMLVIKPEVNELKTQHIFKPKLNAQLFLQFMQMAMDNRKKINGELKYIMRNSIETNISVQIKSFIQKRLTYINNLLQYMEKLEDIVVAIGENDFSEKLDVCSEESSDKVLKLVKAQNELGAFRKEIKDQKDMPDKIYVFLNGILLPKFIYSLTEPFGGSHEVSYLKNLFYQLLEFQSIIKQADKVLSNLIEKLQNFALHKQKTSHFGQIHSAEDNLINFKSQIYLAREVLGGYENLSFETAGKYINRIEQIIIVFRREKKTYDDEIAKRIDKILKSFD